MIRHLAFAMLGLAAVVLLQTHSKLSYFLVHIKLKGIDFMCSEISEAVYIWGEGSRTLTAVVCVPIIQPHVGLTLVLIV